MKILTNIIVAFIIIFSLNSCRDESLNPLLPVKDQIGLVRMDKIAPTSSFVDMTYEGEDLIDLYLTAEGGDVDSYTLYGKVRISGEWTEYKELKTVTEFPTHLMLSAEEILNALELSAEDIPNYSKFYMLGTSKTRDITVDLETVVGAGFSTADNPDGVASGLITPYVEQKHLLKF